MRGGFLQKLSGVLYMMAGAVAIFTLIEVLEPGGELGEIFVLAPFYVILTVAFILPAAITGILGWWLDERRFSESTAVMVVGAMFCLAAEAALSTKVVPSNLPGFALIALLPATSALLPTLFSTKPAPASSTILQSLEAEARKRRTLRRT